LRKHQPDIVLADTSSRSVANAGDKADKKQSCSFALRYFTTGAAFLNPIAMGIAIGIAFRVTMRQFLEIEADDEMRCEKMRTCVSRESDACCASRVLSFKYYFG
jgi:hypothetical protein